MHSRRTFLARAGLLGAAATLSSCTIRSGEEPDEAGSGVQADDGADPVASADREPLRVGLLLPTSGVYTVLGTTMLQGFNLFVDANPDAFGGRSLETVVVDEGETAQSGVDAAQRLLNEEDVDLVAGIVSSGVALNVRDLFHEQQVPLIIANAGATVLTGEAASPYIFRTSFSNVQTSAAIGQYVYDEVAQRGVYLIGPDYAAGAEHLLGIRHTFEAAGGAILGEVYAPFTTTEDYRPFLEDIREAGASAVFAFFAGSEAVRFVQQYAEVGMKDSIPLLGNGFLTEGVLQPQGEAAEGLRTSLHYSVDLDNERNVEFVADFQEAYGAPPDVYAVQAYDAAQLLSLALEATRGNTSNVDAFVQAMGSVGQIDSPRGPFELDENRNPVQTFYLRRVEGGQNVYDRDLGVIGDPLAD